MADIFDGIEKLGKGQFVSIPNYTNSKGEVASYVINGNITYQNVKENDNKKLHECSEDILVEVSNEKNIPLNVVREALNELIASSDRNLSEDNKTAQSEAQTEAYIHFGKGLKMHKESEKFHVDGLIVSKKVIVEGVYPTVNSRPKTIAKNAIEKKLELQKIKYRSFIIEQGKCEFVNLSGMTATT